MSVPHSTDVALPAPAEDEIGLDRLQRRPIIDRIEPRVLALIKKTIAVGEGDQTITDAEVGHFLELTASYGLDPFAREAWIAKSKSGKLLIMVGRDGLRKIAQRNGLKVQTDVVHADDDYAVEFIESPETAKPGEWAAHGSQPFHRVTHKRKGLGQQRGAIVGAWSRVSDQASGREAGFFEAPLGEYKPQNASPYSPWSKQESVMISAAAERQATRQATPLGGLLAVGEDESANAAATIGSGAGDGSEPEWAGLSIELVTEAERAIEAAESAGHALDRATVKMRLNHQPAEVVQAWIADTYDSLAAKAEPEIPEAEVIEPVEPEQGSLDVEPGA